MGRLEGEGIPSLVIRTPPPLYTLRQLVEYAAEKFGPKTAYTWLEKDEQPTVSFAQFWADVQALGTALLQAGIKNEKVALVGENAYRWIAAYFAIVCSGNTAVPIDRELPADDIRNILRSSGAKVLFHAKSAAPVAAQALAAGELAQSFALAQGYDALLQTGTEQLQNGSRLFADTQPAPGDVAAILYTSGTTGSPKGVVLSHGNYMADLRSAMEYIDLLGETLLVLPLHHAFPFLAVVLGDLIYGYPCCISAGLRHIPKELKTLKPKMLVVVPLFVATFHKQITSMLQKNGIADLAGVGRLKRWIVAKKVRAFFGGAIRCIICGGAALDADYVRFFNLLGIPILNGYGTTECSPIVSVCTMADNRPGSVGPPMTVSRVKIVQPDEEGVGKVYVQGAHVMQGYYQMPEETKAAFEDGWYVTGDYGYLSDDGYLFLTGRTQNLIVLSNGKNVYPEELEELLMRAPAIAEAVVFPEGDKLAAEIFPDYGELDPHTEAGVRRREEIEKLVAAQNRSLPVYKAIEKVHFRDTEFEKTTTKKIKRSPQNQ